MIVSLKRWKPLSDKNVKMTRDVEQNYLVDFDNACTLCGMKGTTRMLLKSFRQDCLML